MKRLDAVLLGIVFVVWGALALMSATIPFIQMSTGFRVWGLGDVLFLVLTISTVLADRGRGNDEVRLIGVMLRPFNHRSKVAP